MARALRFGASRREEFALLPRFLTGHFDRVDLGAGYKQLHHFGVPNGTPFSDFSRDARIVVSAATVTELGLARATDFVLEVNRIAVNDQYPSLMPTLYPGIMASETRPFGTLDAMWLALQALESNKTPAINGENLVPCLCRRESGHPPRRGPDPPVMGVARCLLRRLHGRRDRAIIRS